MVETIPLTCDKLVECFAMIGRYYNHSIIQIGVLFHILQEQSELMIHIGDLIVIKIDHLSKTFPVVGIFGKKGMAAFEVEFESGSYALQELWMHVIRLVWFPQMDPDKKSLRFRAAQPIQGLAKGGFRPFILKRFGAHHQLKSGNPLNGARQMIPTDECGGAVAGLLEQLRKKGQALVRKFVVIACAPVNSRPCPKKDGTVRRNRGWHHAKCILKKQTLRGKSIQCWRDLPSITVTTQMIRA